MKSLIFAIFLLALVPDTYSQLTFQKTYGGPDNDYGLSVQQTSDGGYMLFGQTHSFGNGEQDMYLVKTDVFGTEQWSRTYGGSGWEFGISAQQTTDGGYILCGSYSGLGQDSMALIKTDASGNEVWNKRYSGTVDRDVGQFVQQTADGGFIAVGFTGPGFSEDIYGVKTDASGNVQWTKVHPSVGREFAVGVRQTSDGGYAMVGETSNRGAGGQDMLLIKTNATGDTTWTKTYGTSNHEIGRSLYITSDNGFILLGYENFQGGNLFLVKTDSTGAEQWRQYYGGTGWDQGHSVEQALDGGYILAGRKKDVNNDMYCIKTDNVGGLEWDNTFPLGVISEAYSVQQTSDGGYILLGYTIDSTYGSNSDMYLVKINGMGSVSVYEEGLSALELRAYPNPFTEYTTIELNDPDNREFALELRNSQGQLVRSISQVTEGRIRIERAGLASGLYFFRVVNEDQVVAGGKLVVQ